MTRLQSILDKLNAGNRKVKSRIAPTPSGYLHAGNGFNFVLTWALVRLTGGELRLRIDNEDSSRSRPEYLEAIFRDLEWLQLDWETGPKHAEEAGTEAATESIALYRRYVSMLGAQGLAYGCRCSRREIRERSADGSYPGTCRNAGIDCLTKDHATRLRLGTDMVVWEDLSGREIKRVPADHGDPVIWRRDDLPAYHLVSWAEDTRDMTNLIVRGEDLIDSTAIQLMIQQSIGIGDFQHAHFLHHKLLLDSSGKKLSKSAGAQSLKARREKGDSPAGIYVDVASWLLGSGHPVPPVEHSADLLVTLRSFL